MVSRIPVFRILLVIIAVYLTISLFLFFFLDQGDHSIVSAQISVRRKRDDVVTLTPNTASTNGEEIHQDKLSRSLSSINKSDSNALSDHPRKVMIVKASPQPFTVEVDPSVCNGPFPNYPECESKIKWMSHFWKSDPCYAANGVNGSRCSYITYLSEVEHWCPKLPWRQHVGKHEFKTAKLQGNLQPLLDLLSYTTKFDWIRLRIMKFWSKWVDAAESMEKEMPFSHSEKSILLYIGALSDKSGYHFAENAFSGGPLGEMVQWSDLISALYVTGHKLEFATELTQLKELLLVTKGIGGCPTASEVKYDTIFIDITGLKQFKAVSKGRFQHYKCLFRVLDSFGTEPTYNYKQWKPTPRNKDHGQSWGNWELNLRQFMTMFPHTPDNSFLGFAVDVDLGSDNQLVKSNLAVVYGKEPYMWKGMDDYLDIISRYVDIHATVSMADKVRSDGVRIPGYVINHGILNTTSLMLLLKSAKIFIGLGFPYEGPAPLEAIAYGCVFLNPQINPPMHRENTKFFAKKPTDRALASQHPYAEAMIGSPHVRTIDIKNHEMVDKTIKEILNNSPPEPYLPYEFTMKGMLERLIVYLEHQNFCRPNQWPPVEVLKTVVSAEGEDCKETCYNQGLVCEPDLFSVLNKKEAIEKATGISCSESIVEPSVHGPSVSSSRCSVQSVSLLLGCVGKANNVKRVCPCRSYNKGQISLCSSCRR